MKIMTVPECSRKLKQDIAHNHVSVKESEEICLTMALFNYLFNYSILTTSFCINSLRI